MCQYRRWQFDSGDNLAPMKTYSIRRVDRSQFTELAADELRGMAKRGELGIEDEILPSDQTTWQPLSRYTEIADLCRQAQRAGPRLIVEDIARNMRPLVPVVETRSGTGSALVVSRDGFVLTNRHVVDGDPSVLLHFHDGTSLRAAVVDRCREWDLALLKTPITHVHFFDLEAKATRTPQQGEEVVVIGHPLGYEFSIATGHVANPRRVEQSNDCGKWFVQLDARLLPGNSGGPTVDRSGGLIGINTWIPRNGPGLGFAIPATEARDYFRRFRQAVADGKIVVPQVEHIVSPLRLRPDESIRATLSNLQLSETVTSFEESEDGRMIRWDIKWESPKLNIVIALYRETDDALPAFYCDIPASNLESSEIRSSKFLCELMELSLKLAPAHIALHDHLPVIRSSRLPDGLEPSEVAEALRDTVQSFGAYQEWIDNRRKNPNTSTGESPHRLDPKQSIDVTLEELRTNKIVSDIRCDTNDGMTTWVLDWCDPTITLYVNYLHESEGRNALYLVDVPMETLSAEQLQSADALREILESSNNLIPSFVTLLEDRTVIRTARIAEGLEPIEVRDSIFDAVNSYNAYQRDSEESDA